MSQKLGGIERETERIQVQIGIQVLFKVKHEACVTNVAMGVMLLCIIPLVSGSSSSHRLIKIIE
jgi:hypothetical protein